MKEIKGKALNYQRVRDRGSDITYLSLEVEGKITTGIKIRKPGNPRDVTLDSDKYGHEPIQEIFSLVKHATANGGFSEGTLNKIKTIIVRSKNPKSIDNIVGTKDIAF